MPGSSEPQDAASMRKLERGKRGHPREDPKTSGLTEPGKDARLRILLRAAVAEGASVGPEGPTERYH